MATATYERWPVGKPVVKDNVRKRFNDESLRQHADSLKKDGQLRPLLVLRDGTLIAGERTLRAAKLAGLTHVEVKVLEGDLSPREIKKLQLIENLMREGLSDAEIYLACRELMELHPEWLKKDLAAELHFDPSMMTRIFAVDDLIPKAKEQFLAGAFGFSKAYAIAKGSRDDQQRKLADNHDAPARPANHISIVLLLPHRLADCASSWPRLLAALSMDFRLCLF